MSSAKTNRNDPCPCGSGKKFKKCCALKGGMQKYQTSVLKSGAGGFINQISQFGSAMKEKQEALESKKIIANIKKAPEEKTS